MLDFVNDFLLNLSNGAGRGSGNAKLSPLDQDSKTGSAMIDLRVHRRTLDFFCETERSAKTSPGRQPAVPTSPWTPSFASLEARLLCRRTGRLLA